MTFVTPEPYIGHLGLDGVGDTKGLLESEMRKRHIKWITNARVTSVEAGKMHVEEVAEDGSVPRTHDLPFGFSMMLPAFRGVAAGARRRGPDQPARLRHGRQASAQSGLPERLRGRRLRGHRADRADAGAGRRAEDRLHDRNHGHRHRPEHRRSCCAGKPPREQATWNAVCLADFGDGGVAFVAQPQIPPRNVNWSARGTGCISAKVGFEKYFLRKISSGESEPFYEKFMLRQIGVEKLKATRLDPV